MANKYVSLSLVFLVLACDKKESDSNRVIKHTNNSQLSSVAFHPTDSVVPNGFYINNNYRNRIDSYKSIFHSDYPYGPLTITIQGTNAVLYYNDGELKLKYKLWKDIKQIEDGAEYLVRKLNDSLILFWDKSSRTVHEYVNARYLKGEISNLGQFYQVQLFDGKYLCEESIMCIDTVEIKGNVIKGFKGGPHTFDFRSSWNDNFPRMDYLIVNDSIGFSYSISFGAMTLAELIIPEGCDNILDTQCPITEVKRGEHVIILRNIDK